MRLHCHLSFQHRAGVLQLWALSDSTSWEEKLSWLGAAPCVNWELPDPPRYLFIELTLGSGTVSFPFSWAGCNTGSNDYCNLLTSFWDEKLKKASVWAHVCVLAWSVTEPEISDGCISETVDWRPKWWIAAFLGPSWKYIPAISRENSSHTKECNCRRPICVCGVGSK